MTQANEYAEYKSYGWVQLNLGERRKKKRKVVLTAAFAPLSRARVKTSSSIDAVDELKSQGIIAIQGVVAEDTLSIYREGL